MESVGIIAWYDLNPGVSDIEFCESAAKYLGHLRTKGMIESWRITRRKLGLRSTGTWRLSCDDRGERFGTTRSGFRTCRGTQRADRRLSFWRQFPGAKCSFCPLSRFP